MDPCEMSYGTGKGAMVWSLVEPCPHPSVPSSRALWLRKGLWKCEEGLVTGAAATFPHSTSEWKSLCGSLRKNLVINFKGSLGQPRPSH